MSGRIEQLPILVLQPHTRCNCRCVMCDIWKVTESREISAEDLERHLEDIRRLKVRWVVFTGGEPLMHSDLFRLAALLRPDGIRTTILSTGLLLERHAAAIVESTDEVIVSLDGPEVVHDAIRRVPGAYRRLAEGVRSIHQLAPAYPIAARCTIQSGNAAHLRETVAAARELGLRSISFLAADLTSTAFNRPLVWPEDRQSSVAPPLALLEREVEALIHAYPADGFVLESPAKLRRTVSHFRAHYGLESHVAPRCNAPWVSAVLEANGDVRPCFFHPPIGNTSSASLEEVLNGKLAMSFRGALKVVENPICQKCVCSLWVGPESFE
ncbi:MAG TPA: radical SAM protein [Bryobacteraceae bacterium]|nr:radical SAM protein [Bryobacteraceae bacterium]